MRDIYSTAQGDMHAVPAQHKHLLSLNGTGKRAGKCIDAAYPHPDGAGGKNFTQRRLTAHLADGCGLERHGCQVEVIGDNYVESTPLYSIDEAFWCADNCDLRWSHGLRILLQSSET